MGVCLKPERVQQLRESLGLSQQEFAARIGVSRSTYASWESGHRSPELAHLEAIADYGGASVDWLLGRSDAINGGVMPNPDEVVLYYQGRRRILPSLVYHFVKALLDGKDDDFVTFCSNL